MANPTTNHRVRDVARFALAAILLAKPLVGASEQAFQFIQEFTGFFTPGITVIFLMGLFWKRANEWGAIAAALTSVALSWAFKVWLPLVPFMDRMGLVFLSALVMGAAVSLATPPSGSADTIDTASVNYATGRVFNIGALAILAILVALYAFWW